jgi:Txe/YoeB family toxin of Txe-Axe toxin-antitoxin module
METLGTISAEKNECFNCKNCGFGCQYKSDWNRHTLTRKHIDQSQMELNSASFLKINKLCCKLCNKNFQTNAGLWKHKSKGFCAKNNCLTIDEKSDIQLPDVTKNEDLIIMLLKQNADLMEIVKNGTHNTNNNTINNNSHNKAFNLNFFLNDTCKNAMNINEFVDSIKFEVADLLELGEIGYVESMTKIITKNLNALDETVRPIHCTDKKRETFYIKDNDKWEKEDEEMKKLKKLIFRLSNKSYKVLPKYREMFPDYNDSRSIHSDEHCKIIIEAVTCDNAKDEKIIRNISKVTTISKEYTNSK